MLEHATGDLFNANRPGADNDPNSQVLTNDTSVQQTILNQQGFFPTARPGSAQRSRFGAMNPNSPYLLRVPQGGNRMPVTMTGSTTTPDPTAGSDQGRRNDVIRVPPTIREQATIPDPMPTLNAPASGDRTDPDAGTITLTLPDDDQQTDVILQGRIDRDFERELHEAVAYSLSNLATSMEEDTSRQVNRLSSRVGTAMGNVTSIMRAQERRQSLVMGNINRTMRNLNHAMGA
jgi:hypothetical protein